MDLDKLLSLPFYQYNGVDDNDMGVFHSSGSNPGNRGVRGVSPPHTPISGTFPLV